MAFTGQNLIDLARETLNDSAKARYTDPALLKFGNAAIGALALLRPDLFEVIKKVATVAATADQDIASVLPNAMRLYDILRIDGGDVVEECDKDVLTRFYPGWMVADAGNPENWMRHPEDPKQESGTKYYLSPPPATGVQLWVKATECPANILVSDPVPVPNAYIDCLAHYIIFRAESKDDENVVDQRAAQAMLLFMQQTGMAKDAKVFMNDGRPK